MIKIQMINLKLTDNSISLDRNDTDNTCASTIRTNPLPHICNLDPQKLKQLQQQDKHITD